MYPDDVLPAFVAETDFALAEPIRDALLDAVRIGDTGYASAGGLAEAFVVFAKEWFDWSPDPRRVVLVPDVLVGVAEMLRVLTEPGDRVVINTPAYPPFWPVVREYGREIVEVPLLRGPEGWELDLGGLEEAFARGAKAYLLCNPHNPTGRVFTREQLQTIAELANRYDVAIVADEIHAPLTLPGASHTPFVSLDEVATQHAVTVTSASKAWNLPGLKCAVAVAGSESVRSRFTALPHDLHARAGNLGVIASIAAFTQGAPRSSCNLVRAPAGELPRLARLRRARTRGRPRRVFPGAWSRRTKSRTRFRSRRGGIRPAQHGDVQPTDD